MTTPVSAHDGDAELIARLREGVAAKGDGTYHIVEAEEVMDFAADRLAAAKAIEEPVALRQIEQAIADLEVLIERGKGEHGKPGYVMDDTWSRWHGRLRGLQFARAALLGDAA